MCRTCFFTSLYPKPTITVQQLSPNYKSCTEEEEETTNCVTEGEKQKLSRDFILWRRKNRFQTQTQEQQQASKLTFGIAKRAEMQDTV
jgi:hypothetical protein